MSDREKIFSDIRAALAPLKDRSPYPEWSRELPISRQQETFAGPKELFARKLEAANGRYFDAVEKLGAFLREEGASFGYCAPEFAGTFAGIDGMTFDTSFDLAKKDDYAFGITRASSGIAESGTLVLKDGVSASRLGALAPWIHIAVLNESDILPDLPTAIEKFGDDPSIIWCTGPSKTADVEGILIEGVHGPGIQVALVLSKSS
ncbi:MAG: lactate utilization protein C [Opitutales bacterium]